MSKGSFTLKKSESEVEIEIVLIVVAGRCEQQIVTHLEMSSLSRSRSISVNGP